MASSHHPLITGYYFKILIVYMFVVLVQTSSVQLGPAEGFKESSDVIFPGELIKLKCVGSGLTNCDFSLYLNNTVIYKSGILMSGDYHITKNDSFCSLNIQITNVTIQLKGIYKCRVDSGGTTIEDSYQLNVVTEWPHCLAKCVESGNSFQLSCFTVGPTIVSMRWEISKGGSDPTVFLDFIPYNQNEPSFVKTVGVSHTNIKKENNLTIGYQCSHVNDSSQSCFINLTGDMMTNVTPTNSISPSVSNPKSNLPRTSASVSQQPDSSKQLPTIPVHAIIITAVTVGFVILFISLVSAIYKRKKKVSMEDKETHETGTGNNLVPTRHIQNRPQHDTKVTMTTLSAIRRSAKETEDKSFPIAEERSEFRAKDLMKEGVTRNMRYKENQLNGQPCEPYLIVSIGESQEEGEPSEHMDDINPDMVDCVAYDSIEGSEEKENEVHYDVLDPTKDIQ